jgi:hypothetical protein
MEVERSNVKHGFISWKRPLPGFRRRKVDHPKMNLKRYRMESLGLE